MDVLGRSLSRRGRMRPLVRVPEHRPIQRTPVLHGTLGPNIALSMRVRLMRRAPVVRRCRRRNGRCSVDRVRACERTAVRATKPPSRDLVSTGRGRRGVVGAVPHADVGRATKSSQSVARPHESEHRPIQRRVCQTGSEPDIAQFNRRRSVRGPPNRTSPLHRAPPLASARDMIPIPGTRSARGTCGDLKPVGRAVLPPMLKRAMFCSLETQGRGRRFAELLLTYTVVPSRLSLECRTT